MKYKEYSYIEPEAIDLGLSVKWASFNLGATSPEDYGYYFAWGETGPKEEYYSFTYEWCNAYNKLTKYVTDSEDGIVDNRTELEAADDAAKAHLGGDWQIPSIDDWKELNSTNCTWEWTTEKGVNGYKVTSYNGNSIFLPAAGYRSGANLIGAGSNGYYWSRSLDADDTYGWGLGFYSDFWYTNSSFRDNGQSVRAVQRTN